MKLTRLEIQNFMSIAAFEAEFGGAPVVSFEGKNGTGKTSHLKAIMALFAGGKAIPDVPIKRGAKKAQIVGETEDLICVRTFSKSGTRLEVRPSEKGAVKMNKPQQVLDKLIGMFLDPLEFDRMEKAKRLDVLRKLVGLDLSAIDKKRAGYENERRDVGRDLKKAQGALAKLPPAPTGEAPQMSVAEIMAELKKREQANDDRASKRSEFHETREKGLALRDEIEERSTAIRDAELALAEAELQIEEMKAEQALAQSEIERLRAKGEGLAKEVNALVDDPVDDLKAQLADAETIALQAAEVERRAELMDEAKGYADQYEALSAKMAQIDDTRAKSISSAKYPFEGLEACDDGVYLDGVPWDQANSSRRIIASTSIGFAIHPELKIICVENASLLDADMLKAMRETAVQAGGQAFLEIVGSGDEVSVVIEGGEVSP
jgi:DNA repair exonuclease SbcCD ATPase subunit